VRAGAGDAESLLGGWTIARLEQSGGVSAMRVWIGASRARIRPDVGARSAGVSETVSSLLVAALWPTSPSVTLPGEGVTARRSDWRPRSGAFNGCDGLGRAGSQEDPRLISSESSAPSPTTSSANTEGNNLSWRHSCEAMRETTYEAGGESRGVDDVDEDGGAASMAGDVSAAKAYGADCDRISR
jgi:hypothetical protein